MLKYILVMYNSNTILNFNTTDIYNVMHHNMIIYYMHKYHIVYVILTRTISILYNCKTFNKYEY